MKLSKFILGAAAALIAASFIGCADSAGETGFLGKDFEITNPGTKQTDYKRGYRTTKTPHTSAVAEIKLYDVLNTTNNNGSGVVGFIFAVNENDDKTSNFGMAAVRVKKDKTAEYYVSFYDNVATDEESLNASDNFIGSTAEGAKAFKETQISPTSGAWATLKANAVTDADPNYTVYIKLAATGTPNKKGDVEEKDSTGGYTVQFFSDEELTQSIVGPFNISKEVAGNTDKTKQRKLGLYTNVYPEQTLKGKVTLTDTVNEAEIVLE